jgi:DNA-binding IclR family transcriptional regulator
LARRQIKSANRVFEVLEHFSAVRRPQPLRDIVAALGYPSSSTAALLKDMALAGYLSFEPLTRTYLPTVRVAGLGAWVHQAVREESLLCDLVRRVQTATQCTVVVNILNDLFLEHVEFLTAPDFKVKIDPRVRIPTLASPLGWMLLKDQSKARLERTYRRSLAEGVVTRADLPFPSFVELMQKVRSSRMVYAEGWPSQSFSVIAAILPLSPLGRVLAMGVGAKTQRFSSQLSRISNVIETLFAQCARESNVKDDDIQAGLVRIVMPAALRLLTEEGALTARTRSR